MTRTQTTAESPVDLPVRLDPAPKAVPGCARLIDSPGSPYADSPAGWWDQYGGAFDRRSGVVYLPGPTHPPSPFHDDDCPNCLPYAESP